MKFVSFEPYLNITLEEGGTTFIVIENAYAMGSFVGNLKAAMATGSDSISLSSKEKEISPKKSCVLITSPFDLSFDRRELQKKLYADLYETAVQEGVEESFAEIHGEAVSLFEKLQFSYGYEIEYQEDFAFGDLLKHFSVHLKEPEGRFAERLVEYITVITTLTGKNVFFIANCDAYMDADDYVHIDKLAAYYNLNVVHINGHQVVLPNENPEYIIDADMCEIH